jgi:hypothetical protein
MDGHLDLLALDAVRAGDATPEERAHAEACAECRATVARFRDLAARLTPVPVEVPAQTKNRILAMGRPKRLWRPVAAAAAALLVGLGVWLFVRPPAPRRMDIVDAYSVAVRLREGRSVDPKWDLNGDGKVDEKDVEEIVRRSVSIK